MDEWIQNSLVSVRGFVPSPPGGRTPHNSPRRETSMEAEPPSPFTKDTVETPSFSSWRDEGESSDLWRQATTAKAASGAGAVSRSSENRWRSSLNLNKEESAWWKGDVAKSATKIPGIGEDDSDVQIVKTVPAKKSKSTNLVKE